MWAMGTGVMTLVDLSTLPLPNCSPAGYSGELSLQCSGHIVIKTIKMIDGSGSTLLYVFFSHYVLMLNLSELKELCLAYYFAGEL